MTGCGAGDGCGCKRDWGRLAAVGLVLAVAVDVAGFWLLGVLSEVCSLFVGSVTWVAVAGWTVAGSCLAVSACTLAVVCGSLAALGL